MKYLYVCAAFLAYCVSVAIIPKAFITVLGLFGFLLLAATLWIVLTDTSPIP